MPRDEVYHLLLAEIREVKRDVKSLMKFRWMVMGGAATASFLFTLLFEIAKAKAGGK